jgi:hypothetical protein
MGPAGVMLKAFHAHVLIPMAQLWSLAEALDSRFRVPAGETKSRGSAQDRAAEAPQCSRQSDAGISALIITNLEGGWIAAEGLRFYTIASIAEEPAKGFIREVDFGTDGVMLTITGVQVYVPLRQLFAIAEAVDPAFQPPPVGPLTKIS